MLFYIFHTKFYIVNKYICVFKSLQFLYQLSKYKDNMLLSVTTNPKFIFIAFVAAFSKHRLRRQMYLTIKDAVPPGTAMVSGVVMFKEIWPISVLK